MKQNSDSYARIAITDQIYLLRRLAKRITNTRDQIIFRLFLETGCSIEELINLKPQDFEFTTRSIRIGLKQKQRAIKIPPDLSLQINSFINKEQKYIFCSRQNSQITKERVSQIIKSHSLPLLRSRITPAYLRKISIQFHFFRSKSIEQTRARTGIKTLVDKDYLSEEQIQKIREQISTEQHIIIFDILYETGCALKELVNIKVSDLDFNNASIVIQAKNTRNKKKRISRIDPKLSLRIKGFVDENKLSGEDFLFSTRQSARASDKRIFQIIRSYAKKAGVKGANPQLLRNSHIFNSMQAGKSFSEIQEQTGIEHLDIHHYGLAKLKKSDKSDKI